MTKQHLTVDIENRAQKNVQISDELADILVFLCQNSLTQSKDRWAKTKDIENACQEATYGRLERLHDLGFVDKTRKGPKTYVIHTRKDDVVNGEPLLPLVNEELRRLTQHVQADPAIKSVVANELGVNPSQVVNELSKGGFNEKQSKLERAVDAIEEDPSVTKGNYGAVIFRHASNLYQASSRSERLYNK